MVPRLITGVGVAAAQGKAGARPASPADVFSEARRLTARDLWVLQLLIEHQVLTADQVCAAAFDAPRRARRRLLLLTERGVLARFRHAVPLGSQAWRYTAGPLGEAVHAARTGAPLPRPAKVRERISRLSLSPELDHRLGVNGFFVGLLAEARRRPGAELVQWWSARRTAETTGAHVRPDGYGLWRQHPDPADTTRRSAEIGFFLEFDRGSEQLSRVVDKLDQYTGMIRAGVNKPVLFVFTAHARELNFAALAGALPGWARAELTIASTSLDQLGALDATTPAPSPAGPVWRPLRSDRQHGGRVPLIALDPAATRR